MYPGGILIPDTTNKCANARAILVNLKFGVDNNWLSIILETNSLTMKKVLNGDWSIPWSINMEVLRINNYRRRRRI